jgi:hypothetical protein
VGRSERRRRERELRSQVKRSRITPAEISSALRLADVELVMLSPAMVHALPDLPERFSLDSNLPGRLAVVLTTSRPPELRVYALDVEGAELAAVMAEVASLL